MVLHWSSQNNGKDLQHITCNEEMSQWNRVEDQRITEKAWMVEYVATKSIWTIDLVILLDHILTGAVKMSMDQNIDNRQSENIEGARSLGGQLHNDYPYPTSPSPPQLSLSYLFCSVRFGVEESYHNLGYYKDAFSEDELRVKNRFDFARKQNLPLLETSHLTFEVLVDITSRRGVVAIVLLDNRVLRNAAISTGCYTGHYVVLCGISSDENDINCALMNTPDGNDARPQFCMVVKNPGSSKIVELVTPSIFEKAWRAKGTDEDVVFLAKNEL